MAIAIVAILAAIAAPATGRWLENARYREAAREVFMQLRQARALTIAKNREHRVKVELTAQRFVLQQGNRASGSTEWTAVTAATGFPPQVLVKGGKECTQEAGEIFFSFNTNGTSNPRYVCIMEAKNTSVRRYRVGVASAHTGRAVLER